MSARLLLNVTQHKRKDHPMHNQVISSFHDFILDLPGKYEAL